MIQVPPIAATGGVLTSWRNSMRSFRGSRTRREVQFLASPLAVAQMRMRSVFPSSSTWST